MKSKELAFQREVIASFRAVGGYGQKISSRWQVGVPDLLCGHDLVDGLVLIECKHLGEIRDATRLKSVETTTPQRDHMIEAGRADGSKLIAFVAVGWKHGKDNWMTLLPPTVTEFYPSGVETTALRSRRVKGCYDVLKLVTMARHYNTNRAQPGDFKKVTLEEVLK